MEAHQLSGWEQDLLHTLHDDRCAPGDCSWSRMPHRSARRARQKASSSRGLVLLTPPSCCRATIFTCLVQWIMRVSSSFTRSCRRHSPGLLARVRMGELGGWEKVACCCRSVRLAHEAAALAVSGGWQAFAQVGADSCHELLCLDA